MRMVGLTLLVNGLPEHWWKLIEVKNGNEDGEYGEKNPKQNFVRRLC